MVCASELMTVRVEYERPALGKAIQGIRDALDSTISPNAALYRSVFKTASSTAQLRHLGINLRDKTSKQIIYAGMRQHRRTADTFFKHRKSAALVEIVEMFLWCMLRCHVKDAELEYDGLVLQNAMRHCCQSFVKIALGGFEDDQHGREKSGLQVNIAFFRGLLYLYESAVARVKDLRAGSWKGVVDGVRCPTCTFATAFPGDVLPALLFADRAANMPPESTFKGALNAILDMAICLDMTKMFYTERAATRRTYSEAYRDSIILHERLLSRQTVETLYNCHPSPGFDAEKLQGLKFSVKDKDGTRSYRLELVGEPLDTILIAQYRQHP